MVEILKSEILPEYEPHTPPILGAARPDIIQAPEVPNSQVTAALNLVHLYIQQHPEALQALAPEFFDQINAAIDEAPMGLGDTIRNMLYAKVPWAQLILGSKQGGKGNAGREKYANLDEEDEEPEERQRGASSSVLQMAVKDALSLLDAGVAPKDVAENINDVYDLDWSFQTVNRLMMRRPLIQGNNGSGPKVMSEQDRKYREAIKTLYNENIALKAKPVIPQVGLIRTVLRKLW